MKLRPRFSLRTLLVLIALISIPLGWVAHQLNWIKQRREFALRHIPDSGHSFWEPPPDTPWQLKLFGEQSGYQFDAIPPSEIDRAKELFPEIFGN
jgi:hypothetical protein